MIQTGRSRYCAQADATVTLVQSPCGLSLGFVLFSGAQGERLTLREESLANEIHHRIGSSIKVSGSATTSVSGTTHVQ